MLSVKRFTGIFALIILLLLMNAVLPHINDHIGTDTAYATVYRETEPNDVAGQANPISVAAGNSVTGIAYHQNSDWFKFTFKKGGYLNMTIQISSDPEYHSCGQYRIYRASNLDDYVAHDRIYYNSNLGYCQDKSRHFLSAGTYYLQIVEDSGYYPENDPCSYSIRFTKNVQFENCTEPNDVIGKATKMSLGKVYRGVIAFRDINDYDFYKVSAASKGIYYMTVKNVSMSNWSMFSDGSETSLDLRALNNDGNERNVIGKFLNDHEYVDYGKRKTFTLKLPKGNTYIRVGSVDKAGEYNISITKKPSKVVLKKVKKSGKKQIKVIWKKQAGVTGYKVYRATKKKGKYKLVKTLKGSSKTSFKDKKVKKGTRYYYKVCSFKKVNGAICKGTFSKIRSTRR